MAKPVAETLIMGAGDGMDLNGHGSWKLTYSAARTRRLAPIVAEKGLGLGARFFLDGSVGCQERRSCPVIRSPSAPCSVMEWLAPTTANRRADAGDSPFSQVAKKIPANASPAPVVSIAGRRGAGLW